MKRKKAGKGQGGRAAPGRGNQGQMPLISILTCATKVEKMLPITPSFITNCNVLAGFGDIET